MDQIDKYKRVEEDQQQGKGKGKVILQDRKDFRLDRYNNNRPRRILLGNLGPRFVRCLTRVPRASTSSLGEDQECAVLQMTKQDGRRLHET